MFVAEHNPAVFGRVIIKFVFQGPERELLSQRVFERASPHYHHYATNEVCAQGKRR